MASEAKENKEVLSSAVFATAIASCTMFPRILFIVLIVNRAIFLSLLPSLAIMTVVGAVLAYLFLRHSVPLGKTVEVKEPFKIIPALKLGVFIGFVLLASALASTYFGNAGAYIASIIAGMADVDAITLSMSTLAKSTVDPVVAVNSITLAAMTNTLVKLGIAYVLGTIEFGNKIAVIFLPMIITGLIVTLIT